MGAFDDLFDDGADKVRANAALRFGIEAQPDAAARDQVLARRYGLPAAVIEQYRPDYEARAKVEDAAPTLEQSPKLRGWLAEDLTRAKVVHDDLDNMGAVEGALKYLVSAPDAPRGGALSDIARAARAVASGAPSASAGLYGAAAAPFELVGLDSIGGWLRGQQKNAQGVAAGWMGATPDAGLVEQSVLSGFQSAGQNLVMLPAGFAARGEQIMLGLMGLVTGGQSYGKGRDAGLSPAQAIPYAVQDATAEVVTEKYLGAAGFLKNLKAGASAGKLFAYELGKEVPGEIGATLWQNFNEWANVNPDKSVGEFLAEQPAEVLQTVIATLVGGTTQIGAIKGLERAMMGADERARRAQSAETTAQGFEQLHALAAASKVLQRDPDTFEQFVAQAAEGGPVQDVFINAQTLAQSGVAEQLAQISPSVAAQLAEATVAGGDIRIPVAEYATRIAPSEYAQSLVDHLKTEPGGFSRAEAQAYMQSHAEELQAEVERALTERQADDTFRTSADAVKTEIQRQLGEAGRFTGQVNDAYASAVSSFYAVTAAKLGITPEELFKQYPLRVQAEGVAGQSYAQGLPDAADADSLPVGSWVRLPYPDSRGVPVAQVREVDANDLYLPELDANGKLQPEKRSYLDAYTERAKAGEVAPNITVVEMEDGRLRVVDGHRRVMAARAAGKTTIRATVSPLMDHADGRVPMTADAIPAQQLNQSAPAGERNLIVAHNLSADNLRHALEIGGLPAPSLAITKVDSPIQGFGEITLIGDAKLATPGAKNPVFDADVYSPRFPGVKVKVDTKKVQAALNPLRDAAQAAGVYVMEPERVVEELARNQVGRAIGDIVYDTGMRYGYATTVAGLKVDVPMKTEPGRPTGNTQSLVNVEPLASYLKTIDLGAVESDTPESRELMQKLHTAAFNMHFARAEAAGKANAFDIAIVMANRVGKMWGTGPMSEEDMGGAEPFRIPERMTSDGLYQLFKLTQNAPVEATPDRQVVDLTALSAKLDELVDKEQMRAWVRQQLEPALGEKRIVKDGGRTADYTLDNLVKEMTKKVRDAEGFNYGLGNARSKGATKFKNLKAVQDRRGQVQSKADADAAIKANEERFRELTDKFAEFYPGEKERYGRKTWEVLPEVVGESYTLGAERALAENGFVDVPAGLVDELKQFAADLVNLPTEYFEAKPQRAVALDEFKGALIPRNAPADVRAALAELGLPVVEYAKGDEADRARAAQELAGQLDAARGDVLFQNRNDANRGAFNPATNTITLLKNADLSTFLHEAGHFFLETQFDIAARLAGQRAEGASVTAGEQQLLDDTSALLKWFGIESLTEWHSLDFEEKRSYHERFARGFEAYLFEGNAPSIELQGLFQRFRAWLLNVYRELKALNVELTDEVRGVMDRMLASTEEIKLAEQARSMMPLFAAPDQAGMTAEEFAAYHELGTQATADAIQDLQARGLRDMQWLHNAKGREVKRLQKLSAELRREVQMGVRREVMSQPVYRAWQFLTGKLTAEDKLTAQVQAKSSPDSVDPAIDSLHTAIAKLGGLNKEEVVAQWGADPKDKPSSGVFGKPVWRREGGLSIDAMAERLGELGYLPQDENGKVDIRDLEERFDEELRGVPVYSIAHDYSQAQGEQRGGDGINVEALGAGRLDLVDLKSMGLPAEIVDKVQGQKMTAKAGLHPDIVAERFGFSSGDEMVRALAEAQPPKAEIEALTDARMLEQHGELASPEAIDRAADKAIHNDARQRFVATELAALEKATGKPKTLAAAARQFAEAMVSRLRVRDIRPSQYANAEARAAKLAEKAAKAKDIATAAAEKRNQLVNGYATKAAYQAQEEVETGVRYLRKFDSEGVRRNLPADYVAQIDMLLDKYDLREQSGRAIDRTTSLRTWVQSRLNAGEIPAISESLLTEDERRAYLEQINARDEEGNLVYPDDEERIKLLADAIEASARRPYRNLTVEEFRGLVDSVKQIEHLGRLKDRLLTARDEASFAATRDALAQTIRDNAKASGKNVRTDNTWIGKQLDGLRQFGVSHIKPAIWMRIFDGGQDGGAWWSTVVRPANERAAWETTRRAEATEKLMGILGPVLKDVSYLDKVGKGRYFPELGTSLNWEERFAIAANYGNESNLQRLMGGGIAGVSKALDMRQVQAVLRSLTAAEWQAVQAVWDHFESYRPEIAAKETRVNGKEPEWIPARAFTVQTADGQTLNLRGGYFPVVYDPKTSLKAEQHADAQAAKDAMKAAYSAATTQRSFTKSRVEEVTGRPLLLNLRGLYSGVNDVIHDLAWHEWVIDMNRLMRSTTIDEAIREHYGPNVKRELTKWRDDIVAGSKRLDHGIENAAGWARKFVSSAALTYNVMSALLQPLGITQSIARVGPRWVGQGIAEYLAGPIEATERVRAQSEFMRNRSRTMFRDINELRNRIAGQTTARELMGRYGYFLTMHAQMTVDVPTWIGAYNKALAEGQAEDTAVALADQAVKDSQGGGEEVDQSGITRGGPLVKLFTAFYDFMNTQANVLYLAGTTSKTRADAFMKFALVGVATPILVSALKDALTPGDSGDWEDWEKIVKKMVNEGLQNMIGMVAFGREFSAVAKKLMGEDKGQGYSGPTGLRVIPDTVKLAEQATQGEFDDAFRKALINAVGDVSGIPAVQINRTITGAKAVAEGKTSGAYETIAAPVFGFQTKH